LYPSHCWHSILSWLSKWARILMEIAMMQQPWSAKLIVNTITTVFRQSP
jgi:hypothetical protein